MDLLDQCLKRSPGERPPTAVEVYLDVQNVTNRANPEEIVYSPNYSQRQYINGLPILPVVGARLTW